MDDVGSGVILAIPYYGYARQDKRFKPGEPISAKAIGRLLASHCDAMVVLDLHAPAVLEDLPVPVAFTSAMPELAAHLQSTVKPDFVLSPDKGAIDRASAVAEAIGCGFSYLEKTRIDAHTIVHKAKDLDVDGKIVAIVDDMIATGGTICRAAEALRAQGAIAVHAACCHGLFTGGAIHRLSSFVDGVHATVAFPTHVASFKGAQRSPEGSNPSSKRGPEACRPVPVRLYPDHVAHGLPTRGGYPMSVHVRYETPEDVSNKIYELVQACNGGRIKRGSNEVTKVALRKTAAFVVLAEDVNPPELVNHIPLICDDNSIPFGYVPSQEFLAKEAGMETGVKAASLAIMDVPKAAQEMLDEVLELIKGLRA
jgi:ribosomal protein L7Ae-like RNA K-turn-binding protein/adenine/guanine phosphoribosyltransferase-like PRPP-binding protein